ncbi:MAG: MdtA/MuxA family multidrug efflux RND transporter periplasmic adaptor subunit [Burkholderiales bacterium]|nr:MdtA/MuxA family multidrug efflux RND transporter periplasmic adaptor subunit [Burkholderiales bacterium]
MPDDTTHPPRESATQTLTASPPRRRRGGWVVALVILVLAAGGYLWWSGRTPVAPTPGGPASGGFGKTGDAARPLPVIAEPVRRGTLDVYLNALGTVTPRNLVTVKPRVDGQLMKVHFAEGQIVKAGELLAEIDPRPFAVQLAQAQGQLAKDEAQLANAKVDLERYRTLLTQDSIAKQQVDTQQALVRQYEGTLEADRGAVDSAKLQLSYARITAPIAGRVGLRQVDPGNIVHASDANGIVVIAQLQPIAVIFPIPEDNLPLVMQRLARKEVTAVEAWNREGKIKLATGTLVTADNQIDTATGTVKMKAEFANTDSTLFPNQFVNVRMHTQTLVDATLVPSAAIQRGAPGTFVYAVKDDRSVTVAPVKLGPVQGDVTVVTAGVQPGTLVVVDGADKLREGARVDLVTREGQAVAPPKQGPRGPRTEGGGDRSGAGSSGKTKGPPAK